MRKDVLKTADTELIKTISEIVLNVLLGNIDLCLRDKNRLRKYKHYLRLLAAQNRNLPSKRKILVQNGGAFLPTLLTALLSSVVGTVLNNVIDKKV